MVTYYGNGRSSRATSCSTSASSSKMAVFWQTQRENFAPLYWWIASGGGLLGMATATWLAWLTETSWPMNAGGLPTFAWWPNLIIMFELTMLGAILATVTTLVVSARLGPSSKLYDPEVSDGKILVEVENPPEAKTGNLEAALRAAPGAEIKTI